MLLFFQFFHSWFLILLRANYFHEVLFICQAATFSQVLETDEGSDEKAIAAMGLLNTIATLLNVMDNQPQIMAQLQPTVLQVVAHIFGQSVIGKFVSFLIILHSSIDEG